MPPKFEVKQFSRAKTNIAPPLNKPTNKPVVMSKKVTIVEPDSSDDESSASSASSAGSRDDDSDDESEDFLEDLSNQKFVSKSAIEKQEKLDKAAEKERLAAEKKQETERKKLEKIQKDSEKTAAKASTAAKKKQDDTLFATKSTELYGRDKLQLIAKINQYKVLFPDNKQLTKLKLKKNPSVEELQMALSECEAIVETDCVEGFVTDSILNSVKMVEFASVRTRFNIKGLSDMLRQNPQFNALCKQLYLKYKVFSAIPIEMQMILLVTTTASICLDKNKKEASNRAVGDIEVDPNNF